MATSVPYLQAATRQLKPPGACQDAAHDGSDPAEDTDAALEAELEAQVASARAYLDVHRDSDAEPILRETVARSQGLSGAPVWFDARERGPIFFDQLFNLG